MKENNELHRVFYDMQGEWELDQNKFIKAQQEIEKSAGIDVKE